MEQPTGRCCRIRANGVLMAAKKVPGAAPWTNYLQYLLRDSAGLRGGGGPDCRKCSWDCRHHSLRTADEAAGYRPSMRAPAGIDHAQSVGVWIEPAGNTVLVVRLPARGCVSDPKRTCSAVRARTRPVGPLPCQLPIHRLRLLAPVVPTKGG